MKVGGLEGEVGLNKSPWTRQEDRLRQIRGLLNTVRPEGLIGAEGGSEGGPLSADTGQNPSSLVSSSNVCQSLL